MLVCVSSHNFAHETAGAARTRHSLLPLIIEGQIVHGNLGQTMPREGGRVFYHRHSGARAARARNPYSRSWLWIPGLRQEAHPGMTRLGVRLHAPSSAAPAD